MSKFLPILISLGGLAVGVGAGVVAPLPALIPAAAPAAECPTPEETAAASLPDYDTPSEFVKLSNQFIVPVLTDSNVESMVVLTLSLEVAQGSQQEIYRVEPKLRDAFLRVMFDHANMGGFAGNFLQRTTLGPLRNRLLETGQAAAGPILREVLIVDVVKQAL